MRSRRQFLRTVGCGLGGFAFLSRVGWLKRLEAAVLPGATDYRALVCLFLFGGNDGNNTVIPYDDYSTYQQVRGSDINISRDSLLKIAAPSQGAAFGLHPSLPELQALYNQGTMAVLANVGTLAQRITRAEYLAGAPTPDNLFSHADQQGQWQSSVVTTGDPAGQTGWGGRTADATALLAGASFPMVISVAGIPLFTTGATARPFVPASGLQGFGADALSTARYRALRALLALDTSSTLVGATSSITGAGIDDTNTLNTALASLPTLQTVFPTSSLGAQLQQIARIIGARGALGMNRQIFFASLGGFDTHSAELVTQQALLAQVSQALGAFYNATVELGVADSVTTFTLSDFGRTFQPGSNGGTDHAWGSHHFVVGGAVKGGDFYGTYPNLALAGPDDATSQGRWIPTIAVDEYGATLAQWFGVDAKALPTVFPNLGRFSSGDLGFMG